MNRKIFFTLALVAIMLASISFVSAEQNITIDGVDFHIPDGFAEDPNHETVNEHHSQGSVNYVTNGKLFEKGNTIIAILVAEYEGFEVSDDVVANVGGDAKTINGVDGYLKQDTIYYVFSYEKDGKLVTISSTDEDEIGDFLIA